MIILSINNPMLPSNQTFCPMPLFQVVRFEKLIHKQGSWFWGQRILYYLQNWTFHSIFQFISILFALCLHKPYSLLFKWNFDSLEWQFGTYCFYVDLETSSKIKFISVPIHYYYWSVLFLAVKSVFNTFSCVCQIYVAEVLIMHFCILVLSKTFTTIWVPKWDNFGGLTPDPDPVPYLGCKFSTLI